MPGPRSPLVITLTSEQEQELLKLTRSTVARAGLVRRAHMVLLLSAGLGISQIARHVGDQRRIVREWVRRFRERGVDGLQDKAGRGRRPVFSPRGRDASGQDRLRTTR